MKSLLQKRIETVSEFVKKHMDTDEIILDLGVASEMSKAIQNLGYHIVNTTGQDLDTDFEIVKKYKAITAFEIFEHMFAPFNLLNMAEGKLIASVPLKVWFSNAYWNKQDKWDCHYHEFEIKQFNRLLERTGWTIKDARTYKLSEPFGIRPLLRKLWPSFYFVFAVK